ncbi:MAG: DUF362 domain-containing protein [Thermoplasmatota archaeon]
MNKVIFFKNRDKLHEALDYFNIYDFCDKGIPIKVHMGEKNNKYHVRPDFVKEIVQELLAVSARPYLFDTTVCYNSLRNSVKGYEKCAAQNGFTQKTMGCPIIIDEMGIPVTIENHIYEIAKHLYNATHIFALSHVKGHIATGMGGAIKNFGMGGVTKKTKKWMHIGSRPIYNKENCTFCGDCASVCPFDALEVEQGSWNHHIKKCFGCGVCVDACHFKAIDYKTADLQYVLACAAKACLQRKKVIYLNEIKRIARNCDCDSNAGPIICPDVGYVLGDDLVAIDKASLDLINQIKPDIFQQVNHINPYKQIEYAEQIGLGSQDYTLISL